jgi:hypothetical protein
MMQAQAFKVMETWKDKWEQSYKMEQVFMSLLILDLEKKAFL